jgi:hypothetical protein
MGKLRVKLFVLGILSFKMSSKVAILGKFATLLARKYVMI